MFNFLIYTPKNATVFHSFLFFLDPFTQKIPLSSPRKPCEKYRRFGYLNFNHDFIDKFDKPVSITDGNFILFDPLNMAISKKLGELYSPTLLDLVPLYRVMDFPLSQRGTSFFWKFNEIEIDMYRLTPHGALNLLRNAPPIISRFLIGDDLLVQACDLLRSSLKKNVKQSTSTKQIFTFKFFAENGKDYVLSYKKEVKRLEDGSIYASGDPMVNQIPKTYCLDLFAPTKKENPKNLHFKVSGESETGYLINNKAFFPDSGEEFCFRTVDLFLLSDERYKHVMLKSDIKEIFSLCQQMLAVERNLSDRTLMEKNIWFNLELKN